MVTPASRISIYKIMTRIVIWLNKVMVCRVRGSLIWIWIPWEGEGNDLHHLQCLDRKNKRTNNRTTIRTLKANTAAVCYGEVKKELLHGAGLLCLEKW